ncbi:MAG TPA: Rieske (2Fe-2S) protein [Mycobacteriales bacterium]|nr:Rieske (2Fe-2S) protein [Mycobacteriales bacterium]
MTATPSDAAATATDEWVGVCLAADLARAGKLVVDVGGTPVLLLWNDGDVVAMHDTCIHKGRSLSEGVIFAGRLVCAGHQWAYDLHTGYCKVRDRYQPVYRVTVDGDNVLVNLAAPPDA